MSSKKSAMRKYMIHTTIHMNTERTGVRELTSSSFQFQLPRGGDDLTPRWDGLDSVADSMETSALETVYLTLPADQAIVWI